MRRMVGRAKAVEDTMDGMAVGALGVWAWKFREGRCLILIEQSGSDINGQAKINFLLASLKEVCFVFQK